MEFFKWKACYATGLARVDDQHRWLVGLMNEFTALLAGADRPPAAEVQRVFGLLLDYANTHFSDEETLMREVGIDERHFDHHQQQHQAYIRELHRDQEEIVADPAGARALLKFLGHWLVYHILGCDQSMARQVSAIRSGAPPSEAFARELPGPEGPADPLLDVMSAMLEQVMARNGQLAQLNETLEARVLDRTKALQEAVARLEKEMAVSQRLGGELARANESLQRAALTDVLTGLPNRRNAMERLGQFWSESVRHGTAFSCIMIDADGFKQVNDTYGHEAGDAVLRALAGVLRASARNEDVVCRLGGDEFLVLCPSTDKAGALVLAENLRARIAGLRIPAGSGEWPGSLSLGVAQREERTVSPDDLINTADQGLYIAKRAGRNQVGMAQA